MKNLFNKFLPAIFEGFFIVVGPNTIRQNLAAPDPVNFGPSSEAMVPYEKWATMTKLTAVRPDLYGNALPPEM